VKFKVLILFCFLFTSQLSLAQTTRIINFEDLMIVLNSGELVRVIIHYGLCKWTGEKTDSSKVPDAVTGMYIDTYEYFAPGAAGNKTAFVVFSTSKLIQNPRGKGFVFNYGKVRVNSDNSVVVTAKYIHPKSYKVLMNESFSGMLNDGINNEGISLFK
jgi:hypothetical protein